MPDPALRLLPVPSDPMGCSMQADAEAAPEPSDDDLMYAARGGHHSAFETLVRRHQRLVLGLALRFLGDRAAARDVAQEVFLALWVEREEYQPRGRFKAYLVSSTLHRCNGTRRRLETKTRALDALPPAAPVSAEVVEQLVARERQREVQASLSQIPERSREVLVLRYSNGLSLEEIASVTGQPLGTVKSHVFRGLKRLQKLLGGAR